MQNTEIASKFNVQWLDDERTILVCEVVSRWTWADAHLILGHMNKLCANVDYGVYTIFHFMNHTAVLPQGSAIPNLKRMILSDQPNDELILFVGINPVASKMLDVIGQVYGVGNILAKYRFVATVESALVEIDNHKRQKDSDG